MSAAQTQAPPDGLGNGNGLATLTERVKGLRLSNVPTTKRSSGAATWLPWILCLLMAVTWTSFAVRAYRSGGLAAVVGSAPRPTTDAPNVTAPSAEKPKVPTTEAAPGEMVLTVKGTILAAHQIQVSPIEVSGRIEELYIEEGKFFKKGQPLARLDQTPFKADYLEAESALAMARARLDELRNSWPLEVEQAKAQLDEAIALREQYKRDFERYEKLGRNAAEREYDQARFTYLTQVARVKQMEVSLRVAEGPRLQRIAAAEAEVLQAQARFDRARWRLNNTTIVAPVDGIILTKRAEIGNLVNALAMNANLNAGICDMADLTDLEVDLEVQERDIRKVFVGQDCSVVADAYPEWRYQARVDRIMPIANSSKAIIPVRVKVRVPRKEEGLRLRPQMGAVVTFYNREAPPEAETPPDPVKID